MRPITVEDVSVALRQGKYPDAPLQLVVGATRRIADDVQRLPKYDVRNAMNALRQQQHFEHMLTIGTAWHTQHGCDAFIQHRLAQSLVELGDLDGADDLVDEAFQASKTHPKDREYAIQLPEYHGMRGRVRKQKYIQTGDVNFLDQAVKAYEKLWSARENAYFLGVNLLALRLRLKEVGVKQREPDLIRLAHDVWTQAVDAARATSDDPWPLSTASEACLALDRLAVPGDWCDSAELWLSRFLRHTKTGPFEAESYSRQVREIWNGNPLDPGVCAGRLAKIFERFFMRTQRRWFADARQLQRLEQNPSELEKNFSGEKAFNVSDIRKMLAVSPNVGCVTNVQQVRLGTGFLMPGSVFGLAEPLVFVTNAHVIGDAYAATTPGNARITFETEAERDLPRARIDAVLFTSTWGDLGRVDDAPGKLDVAVCRLTRTPVDARGLAAAEVIPEPSPGVKAFVVGHPKAAEMQFSLQDSVLLDVCVNERLMHYRTPTDPGSSGSPVFNQDWKVVALHHAGWQMCPRLVGKGTYEANEGITLHAIRRAMGVTV